MCKHILNAQVSVRAPCCQQWFDCPACHAESESHALRKTLEMQLICKKCKRAFRVDLTRAEEGDEYCPHCDNHFVVNAKTTSKTEEEEAEDLQRSIQPDKHEEFDARTSFMSRYDPARQDDSDRIDAGGVQAALESRSRDAVSANRDAIRAREIGDVLDRRRQEVELADDDLDWS
ncbi:Zn-finger protein [Ceraceosorus bombacis]|uniref:Zn-finger protein n=2 Tax=Ceraceosorus TaxID=401624 RepID=A0A0P1B8C6_9BASI|nr:hypothetical protein IE81DRAFT_182750 [Ceraceosorus guamensis]PWN41262.1 hypothetical protein IE81DRAFT_182750 [Ceraceosorus guamensis]CEH12198.1 Zn-finger protein [Ceraceosorus bombacis]